MSKTDYPCFSCNKGRMISETVAEYVTRLNGINVVIIDAKIRRCSLCDKISVNAREVKRWIAQNTHSATGESKMPKSKIGRKELFFYASILSAIWNAVSIAVFAILNMYLLTVISVFCCATSVAFIVWTVERNRKYKNS